MKTNDIQEEFYYTSATLSSCIRTSNLGIIAVVWALSNQESNELIQNQTLRIVVLLAVFSLFFDVIHYLWRSVAMGISLKKAENKDRKEGKETDGHEYIKGTEVLSYVFWTFKIVLCVISAICLIVYFWNSL